MKKQSARARAQSTPTVRHQLDHAVPTVIHNPEENMTALGRFAHHAMKEPRRYLGWPALIIGGLVLAGIVWKLAKGGAPSTSEAWSKLETAKTPADRVAIAKANPNSPVSTWALLQAATEYFNQALADLPNNRDVALPTSRKALDLFDQVLRDAPHDSPPARVAALGKARVLEMRNELPKAIEQYELVAKDWPNTPEADEARRYAEALKAPEAAAFYKDLYAYSPTKVTLPPMGTETFPPVGPGSNAGTAGSPLSNTPPPLSPGLGIPGIREVVEPQPGGTPQPAQPKPSTPAVKPEAKKPAGTQKDLPPEVFTPK
jgi:tetratricopeptide (TPR) repeat protein